MKSRLALSALLTLALAVSLPVAASTARPGSSDATVAKKKATYCSKKAKKEKAAKFRAISKVKSQKAYLYINKRKTEYLFCSESPKFTATVSRWEGIAKTGKLLAVRNNCAVFYSETKPGSGLDNGVKEVVTIPYKYFRKNSDLPPQLYSTRLGFKEDVLSLQRLTLSKNCVWVAGYVENNVPTIAIAGAGDFPYQGFRERTMPGMTIPELKAIGTTILAPGSVRVSWTQNGVPKSDDYPGDAH